MNKYSVRTVAELQEEFDMDLVVISCVNQYGLIDKDLEREFISYVRSQLPTLKMEPVWENERESGKSGLFVVYFKSPFRIDSPIKDKEITYVEIDEGNDLHKFAEYWSRFERKPSIFFLPEEDDCDFVKEGGLLFNCRLVPVRDLIV